jgi:hypothetical protein
MPDRSRPILALLEGGLEPPHLSELPPQSSVSTNSTIRASIGRSRLGKGLAGSSFLDFYLVMRIKSKNPTAKMNGSMKSMPVGDLFSKIKLIFWGLLIPTLAIVFGIALAPILLRYDGVWKKAEVLIVELDDNSSTKQWQTISQLNSKSIFNSIWIVLPRANAQDQKIQSVPNPEEIAHKAILNLGVEEIKIHILKMDEGEPGSVYFTSKAIIKNLVNNDIKSVLVFCNEYQSQRILNTYKKNLAPIGIEVSVYPAKSDLEPSNWFLKEKGIKLISQELFLYIYYKIRGYQ